jgi:transposase
VLKELLAAEQLIIDPMGTWMAIDALSEWGRKHTLEIAMQLSINRLEAAAATRARIGAIFVSMELSRLTWLITSLSPSGGEKMSKHSMPAGDVSALLGRFAELRRRAFVRTGESFPIIVIQEAGLDGFWIHRALEKEGIESHVVDPASIATSRRRRRAKTDRIDGETLLRTLMAHKRGEPRVCAMVKAPNIEEEDRRRLCRERKALINERVQHVNRIRGLLFSQGVTGYSPLHHDRRQRLELLKTGDGRLLPEHLKAQISRELDRLELLLGQIKAVEAERDTLLAAQQGATCAPAAMILDFKGIGPEFAAVLWSEGLFRRFDNRRQVASYAGLTPTPWQSGSVDREQGVSKTGNPRLRTTLIQLAWLWLRHQPQSALTLWFKERVKRNGGRLKKTTIVALARKLLVALWKYVTAGVVIEGAVMNSG